MSNYTEIEKFLNRYRDFSKHLERQKIIYYKTRFNGLFSGYESLMNLISSFNKKEAIHYNIFDILNINAAEVKLHTPFLHNLLNPKGTHGQSDIFLTTFIQNFIPAEKRDFFVLNNKDDYQVVEEKPINNGRIDIYIHSINPKKKFGIIIENKLYAGDQHLQLNRYYDFIKDRKYEDHQILIFYLTIEGHDPSFYSIDKKLLTELKNRNILHNISYKTNIKHWLKNTISNIESDKVKYTLEQYLRTIDII